MRHKTSAEIIVPFYIKKYFRITMRRRQKLMTLLINQVLFSFEMRKCASFAEMNMILMTITKTQLLSFDSWIMWHPSWKFCNSYLLKNFTLIKALFFLINRFCRSCVCVCVFFFCWLFNPFAYRDNPQLLLFSNEVLYSNSYHFLQWC